MRGTRCWCYTADGSCLSASRSYCRRGMRRGGGGLRGGRGAAGSAAASAARAALAASRAMLAGQGVCVVHVLASHRSVVGHHVRASHRPNFGAHIYTYCPYHHRRCYSGLWSSSPEQWPVRCSRCLSASRRCCGDGGSAALRRACDECAHWAVEADSGRAPGDRCMASRWRRPARWCAQRRRRTCHGRSW